MADIIVFGATGFSGRLVTQYLNVHPQRSSFTFGICARSKEKIAALQKDLKLDDSVKVFYADVTNRDEVESVVKESKIIINAAGPFWRHGTPVVRACAEHGKHYVDLTGEPHWILRIIYQLDYLASKTHTIIIPASGLDSIPSDLAVYLSNKTLKTLAGRETGIETSISGIQLRGAFSGGTIQTILNALSEVPPHALQDGLRDYALSTGLKGAPSPTRKLLYTLPFSSPPIYGGMYMMADTDRAIVQRTWGINQLRTTSVITTAPDAQLSSYGPRFKYEEFMIMPSKVSSLMLSFTVALGAIFLMFPPFRWLFGKLMPQPGEGPSEKLQKEGFIHVINVTSSVPAPSKPQTHVRTIIHGQGDPYALSAVMVSESALALLLSYSDLPEFARGGGVLTPASALGDVLVKRLTASGRMTFESEQILQD